MKEEIPRRIDFKVKRYLRKHNGKKYDIIEKIGKMTIGKGELGKIVIKPEPITINPGEFLAKDLLEGCNYFYRCYDIFDETKFSLVHLGIFIKKRENYAFLYNGNITIFTEESFDSFINYPYYCRETQVSPTTPSCWM